MVLECVRKLILWNSFLSLRKRFKIRKTIIYVTVNLVDYRALDQQPSVKFAI